MSWFDEPKPVDPSVGDFYFDRTTWTTWQWNGDQWVRYLREKEVMTMCVKCDVNTAANAGDWKEVARLAREQDKTEKAEEADDAGDKKAATSKVSSKKD